ncbi:MAG TPA: prephenate dehydrogenase/arogenate dehydrogenase family protein [Candidatus Limnocylindrales bacterium]|nr:prephenate dehydrogenase/arogenate dehydrogenase family protein [Candidatus Limnocylindrales bacterium]
MRVAFLGFGLIGGSIARALRRRESGGWQLAAWTPNGEAPRAAVADGTIDAAARDVPAAVRGADIVVLASPPLDVLRLLDGLSAARPEMNVDVVITDVASTKRTILARAESLGLPFVGGHPMAGREASGYAAADAELFVDRPWVICAPKGSTAAAIDRVESLARATGARPLRMEAAAHDAAVAVVSHVPLVVSAALVEAATAGTAAELGEAVALAAGGWASMTRLARGDVAMGAGILSTNADLVAERLHDVRDAIDAWLERLEAVGSDGASDAAMRDALERARSVLGDAR